MSSVWKVDEVRAIDMLCDKPKTAHTCYEVEVVSGWRRKTINACIANEAMADLPQEFDEKMKQVLVRAHAESELDHGWDPEHAPWLSIEKKNMKKLVQEMRTGVK